MDEFDERKDCGPFIRDRITELRIRKGISEHRMSLDLDRSGGYIRMISNGLSMPSLQGLTDILDYLGVSFCEFFDPLGEEGSPYYQLCRRLRDLDQRDLEKVSIFLDLIEK